MYGRFMVGVTSGAGPIFRRFEKESRPQEYGVTAILNLSLCDENKELIMVSGAIRPLVKALQTGTVTAKENAACALLRLSQVEENKTAIGRSGAIPLLVYLLENDSFHGKKDASTTLYSLCSVKENKIRAVQAGIMKPLVELMADLGGIPVLVEIVEVGSHRQKEIAAAILLQICEDSLPFRAMVAREGAIPPLVALSQSGTTRVKQKAEALIDLLRRKQKYARNATTDPVTQPQIFLAKKPLPNYCANALQPSNGVFAIYSVQVSPVIGAPELGRDAKAI
ncbi:hypothetical protein NE237_004609 [Protea cynaroides]|uniref:Uncharacterized protein n=1 Tax=Protea cynaroides TaxID=273540 RepID=A0A9Q0KJA4_9MAGN|nr:hypothetical protein NE237_004609 [Protea cynaroides]